MKPDEGKFVISMTPSNRYVFYRGEPPPGKGTLTHDCCSRFFWLTFLRKIDGKLVPKLYVHMHLMHL